MRQLKQNIKKTGLLLFPIFIFLGMTNCSQFQSFSEAESVKFLSENPIFSNTRHGQDPNDDGNRPPITCVPGYALNSQGTACEPITCSNGQILNTERTGCETLSCPAGQRLNNNRTACVPITCPAGQTLNINRTGCVAITCSSGYRLNSQRTGCEPISCPAGQRRTNGVCRAVTCPAGQTLTNGVCRAITCPTGQMLNANRTACVRITCPAGQTLNANRTACVPITCPAGQALNNNRTACAPITCPAGQRLNRNRTGCVRITCPSGYRLNRNRTGCDEIPTTVTPPPQNSGDGGDGGGDGGDGGGDGCPLMLDSQGVEYADIQQLRNSDDSYLKSGELTLSSPENGVQFDLLGKQTKAELDNGDFLHIKPQAHNFKFQISWTQTSQSRYRWLTLPDENGHINGIDQLFGDNTFGPNTENPFAKDGFRALMKWDLGNAADSSQSFADGYIDDKDAVFGKLRLWHDLNGDGNCNTEEEVSSELVSLSEVGITYIHLSANENFFEKDVYGNSITYKSLVGFTASSEGTTRLGTAFDIWFKYDPSEILSTGYAEIKPKQ